ncbi:MAG TPA: hypothetical protein VGS58_11365 [Candidatus Sulfopaludibacter sp.]|nr:hypothetical protein [Candidatus Sulfopaludibacter sp.]
MERQRSINQAVPIPIDPFNVTHLFVNCTIRGDSWLRGTGSASASTTC